MLLHKVNNGICSSLSSVRLPKFPCLLEVIISLGCPEIVLQMWSFSKDVWRDGRCAWFRKLKKFRKVSQAGGMTGWASVRTANEV
jgi:hypothetical protein